MDCKGCSIPEPMDGIQRVYVWCPQAHTGKRVAEAFVESDPQIDISVDGGCVILRTSEPSTAIVRLSGVLTSQEAQETKVLLMPDREPTLNDFAAVGSIRAASDRIRAQKILRMFDEDRYFMYMQPIIDAREEHRFGFEYLLRGTDKDGKLVPAGMIFEEIGEGNILFSIDRAARLCAVETAARAGLDGHVFINFTPGAIYDPKVCLRTTDAAVSRLGLCPEQIVFEVVESLEIDDLNHLRGVVNFYRRAGYKVALDDFGSGFSNFETYFALQPDFMKIDKSITSRLHETGPQDLLYGLIANCRQEGVKTIAEGIETPEQAQICRSMGSDYLQGYLFGRPAPPDHWRSSDEADALA